MPNPDIKNVVMVVHGIRDYAPWMRKVHEAFEEVESEHSVAIWEVKTWYLDLFRFLAPKILINMLVEERVAHLAKQYDDARREYPNAEVSIIGHSFGTHVITQFLRSNGKNTEDKLLSKVQPIVKYLIICGSIVKRDFDWSKIADRVGKSGEETKKYLFNDCGNADPWPTIGARAGWIYGDIGTNGAGCGFVTDRVFKGNHSFFNDKKYMKRYWAELILNGDNNSQKSPLELREGLRWYVKLLEKLPLNWIILIITGLAIYFAIYYVVAISGCGIESPPLISVDMSKLEATEVNRLKHVKSQEGKHNYKNWEEAFLLENLTLISEIKKSAADQSAKNPDLYLVAAPAASGKGKLARIVRDQFRNTSIKIRYDRSLKSLEEITNERYLSIPIVESWEFTLPKPSAPLSVITHLVSEALEEKNLQSSDIQVLIVDGIDEVHINSREPVISALSDGGQSLLNGFQPNAVVFLARAEGFIEYFKENKEEKSNVRARSLSRPIPSSDKEFLAAWDDFERWELRVATGETEPANPTPLSTLPLLDDKFSEIDVTKGKAAFIDKCQTDLLFRESVSYLDILNYSGFYFTKPPADKASPDNYFDCVVDSLLERNKGTHNRPSNSPGNSYGSQYLKILCAVAANRSNLVDDSEGYFPVSNLEELSVPIALKNDDGTDKKVIANINLLKFLCHSGFVELEPLSSSKTTKRFRFAPIWMHKHLATKYLENDFNNSAGR